MRSESSRKLEARFLAITLAVFGILSFYVVREYMYYVIGGLLLVFSFMPVHRRLRKFVKRRTVAAFVSFLLVAVVVVGPLVLVVTLVFNDAVRFAQTYDPDQLNETIQGFLSPLGVGEERVGPGPRDNGTAPENLTVTRPSEIANWIGDTIKRFAERIGSELVNAAAGLAIGLVIAGFVIYYGFAEGDKFYGFLRNALPLPDDIEEALFRELRRVTQVVFVGNILVSALGGFIGALTFIIFGIPNAVFWGFVMIILGILPVVGAPLVWLPAALLMFVDGRYVAAISILVVNGGLVIGYIDNILRPQLIGKVANVHPVLVLVGVLGGIEVFGPLGFVIGPLVLAIFIAMIRIYTEWHPRWQEVRQAAAAQAQAKAPAPEAAAPASPAANKEMHGSGFEPENH